MERRVTNTRIRAYADGGAGWWRPTLRYMLYRVPYLYIVAWTDPPYGVSSAS